MQQTYRIFLASSYELKADREQFEIFIARQNNLLKEKGVYLQVVLWEDIGAEVYPGHKQDHYNKELKTCDIFVMLYWSKVGKYTNIEFDRALGQFRFTEHNPKMYVFEKTATLPKTQTDADKDSLAAFKKKYADEGQFPIQYKDAEELTGLFKTNLDKLFADKYLVEGSNKYENPAELLYTDGNSVPSGFIGRDAELKTIKEKLDKGGSLMLINAEGGIGKTSLAAKYWEESLYDYQHNAWLFCEAGIISALKKLAPKLKVDLAGLNEEQQTEAMKQALMPIANDTLLVLDNANKAEDINDFIKIFRGLGWHVLFTSRCHGVLENARELHIAHLPPQQAKELFESNYKEDTPEFDALLDRLLAAIDYHTLLTEIFSKNLAELKGTDETLDVFLNKLETKGLFLEERSFKIKTDYTLNVHKNADHTDAIIEILYDFRALEEPERHYLVNLAILPAVNYELKFLLQLLEPIKIIDLKKILHSLFKKGWLGYSENGYRISPVIQRLILEKSKDCLQTDTEKLIDNLIKRLKNDGHYLLNLNYNEVEKFVQLVAPITDSFNEKFILTLGVLNDSVCIYHFTTGDLPAAKKAAEKMEQICEFLNATQGLAVSYSRLGEISEDLGDLANAMNYHQKELKLIERLYEADPLNNILKKRLAIAYQNVGDVFYNLNNNNEALTFFEKYNELAKQLSERYFDNADIKRGLAISYQKIGDVHRRLGNFEKALEYYQDHNEFAKQLYKLHHQNIEFKNILAISYGRLGIIFKSLNDVNKALEFCKKYNELEIELHEAYPYSIDFKNGVALAERQLGEIYVAKLEVSNAIVHYLKAQSLWQELVKISPQMVVFERNLRGVGKQLSNLKRNSTE